MVLGDLDSYLQKTETWPPIYTIPQNNSRWVKDLNISHNTIKVLEENIGSKISDISHSNIFDDVSSKAREIKEKINKWDYVKLKSFCTAKKTIFKMKMELMNMGVHKFFRIGVLGALGYIPSSGITGSMFNLLMKFHTVFHSCCTSLYSHQLGFPSLHNLASTCLSINGSPFWQVWGDTSLWF